MHVVPVNPARTPYSVVVGSALLKDLGARLEEAGLCEPFLIISQPRIFKAAGKLLGRRFPVLLIPDGERAKTFASVNRILNRMAELKMTRQATLVAFGGGVVGDVAGFAASLYMRGVAVVQVPTTLLAQVDSSIGGKTGVNFRDVKNLVGTFHQPRLVLSDVGLLRTLPAREYASGLYEALKYGILGDAGLFEDFGTQIDQILQREPRSVEDLVARCAAIKAGIVSKDEKEGDLRRVLNLGHTIGHALESAGGFRRLKHGEAVGYGMIAAARLSRALGKLSVSDAGRIESTVGRIGKLPSLDGIKLRVALDAMQHDKKVRDGAIHFILPIKIGRVEITPDVPVTLVREVVRELIHENSRGR